MPDSCSACAKTPVSTFTPLKLAVCKLSWWDHHGAKFKNSVCGAKIIGDIGAIRSSRRRVICARYFKSYGRAKFQML